MTPERWRQVTEIFHDARAKDAPAREAFLQQACGADASLRADVDVMLGAHDAAGTFGGTRILGSMPHLQPGTTLGPYQVEALVGTGGMGEVYRATDTRLKRTVALKFLAADLSADPDSRAQFRREAQLLAALNHPHIAAIHGVEETAAGGAALVLEFVEGSTLAEIIARGPALKIADALKFARQIAEALSAAHERGIVHRDLKPANIKITPAGVVKVLDFGIAKLAHANDPMDGSAPTFEVTREGVIIGTTAYMSPEQARGIAVDKRSDIWAFGCVLYEMLTGRRAFDGGTASDTVARILEREPSWDALPSRVPESIRTLLRRCLKKDPADRLHDIADARLEIADALATSTKSGHEPAGTTRVPWMWVALAAAVVVTAGALWWALARTRDRAAAPAAVEFGIRFPDNHYPSSGVAVSPDGRKIAMGVFAAGPHLWMYSLDSADSRPLPGTEGAAWPFWSPNSATIGFFQNGQIRTIDPASGQLTTLCDLPVVAGGGATWGTRGVIVFANDGKMFQIPVSGGTPVPLSVPENRGRAPIFLPDQRHFIYFTQTRTGGSVQLASVDGGPPKTLVASDGPPAFAPPDQLLFVRGTALQAQTLNQQRFELEGEPAVAASSVSLGLLLGPRALVSASADVLAFARPLQGSVGQLTWFERSGQSVGVLPPLPHGEYLNPAISPDGRQIAVNLMDPVTGNWDIWTIDVEHGVPQRLTSDPARDTDPVWSPTGKEIVFVSERGGRLGLYRQLVSGSAPPAPLVMLDDQITVVPSDWSRDGKYILYNQLSTGRWSVWALPLFGDGKPIQLMDESFAPYAAHVSPDGRWLAYISFKTGPGEVYVRRFLEPGQEEQISHGGGVHPRWTKEGHELVYWAVPGGVNAVDFESDGSTFHIGARRTLIQAPVLSLIDARTHYDVTRDGARLLVRQPAGPQGAGIEVILNWTSKLQRR